MSELGSMAEQLRRIRQAEQEFLLRAAIDNLIVEPMFLDGLLQAVQDVAGACLTFQRSARTICPPASGR